MITAFFSIVVFLFGLAVGSFLNCVIYRLEINKTFLTGRSFCPYCKKTLSWRDLIPVFSFLALNGKCRYCGQKISWQYPLVELATALLFLLIFNFRFSINSQLTIYNFLDLLYYLIIACFLIIIFVYDLKHYIIPDNVVYPAIITAFIYQIFGSLEFGILKPILSAFLASIFFGAIVLISRGKWMGAGDIKLAFLMGLILIFPNILVALFLSFSLGAIIGIGLIAAGRKKMSSEIPFAPFLVAGTMLTMFWGKNLLNWYLNFFV